MDDGRRPPTNRKYVAAPLYVHGVCNLCEWTMLLRSFTYLLIRTYAGPIIGTFSHVPSTNQQSNFERTFDLGS